MSQPGNTHRVVCCDAFGTKLFPSFFLKAGPPTVYTAGPPDPDPPLRGGSALFKCPGRDPSIDHGQLFPRPRRGRNLPELEPVGPGQGYSLRDPVSRAPRRGDERGWWSGTRTRAGRRGAGPRPPRVRLEPTWVTALGVGITPGGEGVGRLQLLFLIEPWAPRFNGLVKMM